MRERATNWMRKHHLNGLLFAHSLWAGVILSKCLFVYRFVQYVFHVLSIAYTHTITSAEATVNSMFQMKNRSSVTFCVSLQYCSCSDALQLRISSQIKNACACVHVWVWAKCRYVRSVRFSFMRHRLTFRHIHFMLCFNSHIVHQSDFFDFEKYSPLFVSQCHPSILYVFAHHRMPSRISVYGIFWPFLSIHNTHNTHNKQPTWTERLYTNNSTQTWSKMRWCAGCARLCCISYVSFLCMCSLCL